MKLRIQVVQNKNPLGQKDKLISANDNTLYDTLHQRFHPSFHKYQQQFGLYDIFLVDAKTGRIIYTVFKETDFSTSLIDGPFANSDIGKVFRAANQSKNHDFVALSDYDPYAPSYLDESAFIASPIFNGDKIIGVLIFQFPVNQLSSVMTHHEKWHDVGLGKIGETYLIGPDRKMRSDSREFIEHPQQYLAALVRTGGNKNTLSLLRVRGRSIGLQTVDTPAAKKAIKGESGYQIYTNRQGIDILSAFAPLKITGLQWAVIAEIQADEAFASVQQLQHSIATFGLTLSFIVLIVGAIVGLGASTLIVKPLEQTVHAIRDIA